MVPSELSDSSPAVSERPDRPDQTQNVDYTTLTPNAQPHINPSLASSAVHSSDDAHFKQGAEETTTSTDSVDDNVESHSKPEKKGHPSQFEQIAKRTTRLWQDTWIAEVLSCAIAFAGLAAMATTLAMYQGRPMPKWPRDISINTMVSVFSAIMKAGLMMPVGEGISQLKYMWFSEARTLTDLEEYDGASRGPWGSFLFLVRPRKHYLAIFGAIITLIAMAIDPFSQQVLQYYNCFSTIPTSVARVPRTNNYTTGVQLSFGASAEYTLNPPFDDSNLRGFADAGASYQTLSMCNTCADISSTIINDTDSTTNFYIPAFNGSAGPRLGGGVWFNSQARGLTQDSLFTLEALMVSTACGKPGTPACAVGDSIPFAFRCSLVPCVKTFTSAVKNFALQEKLVSMVPLKYTSGNESRRVYPSMSVATDFIIKNGTRQSCPSSKQWSKSTPVGLFENNTLVVEENISPHHWTSDDCIWAVDAITVQKMAGRLRGFYHKQYLSSGYNNFFDLPGDLWITNLYHNASATVDTVSHFMGGLAAALASEMRQGDVVASPDTKARHDAIGVTQLLQTCIAVRWAWISLPASLVALSVVFLAITMWSSLRHAWYGKWKSSTLALLFSTVESDTLVGEGVLRGMSDMSEVAAKMQVRFTQTDRGWGFVESTNTKQK